MYEIINKDKIAPNTYKMDIKADQLPNSLLAKVNRAIKLTQAELQNATPQS